MQQSLSTLCAIFFSDLHKWSNRSQIDAILEAIIDDEEGKFCEHRKKLRNRSIEEVLELLKRELGENGTLDISNCLRAVREDLQAIRSQDREDFETQLKSVQEGHCDSSTTPEYLTNKLEGIKSQKKAEQGEIDPFKLDDFLLAKGELKRSEYSRNSAGDVTKHMGDL